MCKSSPLSITFIIVFTLTITGQSLHNTAPKPNRKQAELPEGIEVTIALARLGDLTRPTLRERLKQMRQPANLSNNIIVQKRVESENLQIANNKRVDQLKAALQPVLDYHDRSRMPIYVLWSDQPKAYLVDRAVLFITTRLMLITSDEEIRGIVAHELAHEYVWKEQLKAREAKDWQLLRECELFCDAVAAFTLKELGDDPASYARALVQLDAPRHTSDTHPSLDTRKKLNKFLCQRLD